MNYSFKPGDFSSITSQGKNIIWVLPISLDACNYAERNVTLFDSEHFPPIIFVIRTVNRTTTPPQLLLTVALCETLFSGPICTHYADLEIALLGNSLYCTARALQTYCESSSGLISLHNKHSLYIIIQIRDRVNCNTHCKWVASEFGLRDNLCLRNSHILHI